MNTNTLLAVVVALLIGGISGYVLSEQMKSGTETGEMAAHYHDEETVPEGMHRMPDGSLMSNDGTMMHDMDDMGAMDGHMMDMTVSSEREFIVGMIPHHQEAVDTAEEVLARGATTPAIRDLATHIIEAQEREIAMMKAWHADWYGEPYVETGDYMPMMRDLSSLSGADLDRTFLEDMIPHHMGAIMMARSVEPYIEHQEVRDLTVAIMETQSAEIREMRALLSGL